MNSLLIMISFFTRIPIKLRKFDFDDFKKGIKFLPLIGLFIGILLYYLSYVIHSFDKPIISLIILIFYLWITGGLHIDGLADTSDGVFSGKDSDGILEIMKDSSIGTFGAISIVLYLNSTLLLLCYIDFKYLIILPVIGRCCGLFCASISNYSRKDGFGKVFIESSGQLEVVVSIVFPFIISLLIFPYIEVFISIFITFILSFIIRNRIVKKINGLTGDNIGFIIEVTQLVFLISIYILKKVM